MRDVGLRNDANGINDLGDIVGDSNDADGNWLAARWSTAVKVNNYGIATGGYGVGDNPERAVAVQFRRTAKEQD